MIWWIIGAMALAMPLQVSAQRPSKDVLAGLGLTMVEPMSPEQTAETKSEVDAALAEAGVSSWFENMTDRNAGQAKHLPSGLVCLLGRKGQRVISASANGAACMTRNGDTSHFTTVVRAPAGTTLDTAAATALAEAQKESSYAPFRGITVTGRPKPGSGLPEHRTIRFSSRVDGRKRASIEQVGVVRGWILTERNVGPITKAQPPSMAGILAEATFGSNMTPR